jgi:hypothetical protein
MDKYKMKEDKTLNLRLTHSLHKCRLQMWGLGTWWWHLLRDIKLHTKKLNWTFLRSSNKNWQPSCCDELFLLHLVVWTVRLSPVIWHSDDPCETRKRLPIVCRYIPQPRKPLLLHSIASFFLATPFASTGHPQHCFEHLTELRFSLTSRGRSL